MMKPGLIGLGILCLAVGFIASTLLFPTITFEKDTLFPTPHVTMHPFAPIGTVLYLTGGILLVCGFFENTALRVIFSLLVAGWVFWDYVLLLAEKLSALAV